MEFDLDRYQPMPVRYELRYVMLKKLRDGVDPLPDIQGRDETKRDVIRAVLSNSHPYLVSREGTGKTRLAESLAKLLPPVPKVKGCPYNCDPKWPPEWQCPSCQDEEDPEIEIIAGKQRYSRIQGNEYTNEAKILGVKDIQAIIKGGSPTDPRAFIGTGVLRGNRGVVAVDELPAIPTKVQVLFHPMLQENKIILEEYAWERPIDLFFVATGNPTGFAHVNQAGTHSYGAPRRARGAGHHVQGALQGIRRVLHRQGRGSHPGAPLHHSRLTEAEGGRPLVDRGHPPEDHTVHPGLPQHRPGRQHPGKHQSPGPHLQHHRDARGQCAGAESPA